MALELVGVEWHDVLGFDSVRLKQALQASVVCPDAQTRFHQPVASKVFRCQRRFVVEVMSSGELHDGRLVGPLIDCDGRRDTVHREICSLDDVEPVLLGLGGRHGGRQGEMLRVLDGEIGGLVWSGYTCVLTTLTHVFPTRDIMEMLSIV